MAEEDSLTLDDIEDVTVAAGVLFDLITRIDKRVLPSEKIATRRFLARFVRAYGRASGLPDGTLAGWASASPDEDDRLRAVTMRRRFDSVKGT